MTEKSLKLGKYRHYRESENLYEVIGLALHSETHEEMVVYKALYDSEKFGNNRVWVRPKEMFLEDVEYDGVTVPRFQFVEFAD
jgi:hypothetical protein